MSQLNVDAIRSANGTGDAISLAAASNTCTANITNIPGRNLIQNGSFNIWQRGNGPYTIAYSYTADRWTRDFSLNGSDYFHIEKKTESPPEFSSSLEVSFGTAQASIGAAQYAFIRQKIEAQNLQHLAYGTSSAKKMTLSFWVRSTETGTYAINLQQGDNSNKQVSFNYSISSADTWEKKSISIPADTAGVINNDNGEGLNVTWWLCAGSNMTSGTLRNTAWTAYAAADQAVGHNVNLADNTSNTWYITGVQLELGEFVSDYCFESYGETLRKCQRYYQAWAAKHDIHMMPARGESTDKCYVGVPLCVPIRAEPTVACASHRFYRSTTTSWSGSTTAPTIVGWTDASTRSPVISILASGHSASNNEAGTWSPEGENLLSFDSEL